MSYKLAIDRPAADALAAMPEDPHDLFVMACVDLIDDPYTHGVVDRQDGPLVTLTLAIGGMGFIVYDVDETASTVTITITITQIITLV